MILVSTPELCKRNQVQYFPDMALVVGKVKHVSPFKRLKEDIHYEQEGSLWPVNKLQAALP